MARTQRTPADEVPLNGLLAEFRTALRSEIEAARRTAASSAIPVANGRRISQILGRHQYVFDIENTLNVPSDSPGDLLIPGREPIAATIISVEGPRLTISIADDLGSFIPVARLQSNLTYLLRKLIERIEAWAGKSNAGGARILNPCGNVAGDSLQLVLPNLNQDQALAVGSSLGRDCTFIWGPPGTGKTKTIGTIGEQLYRRTRSLLLVSHTNTAVDQALWQIGELLDPQDLASGTVIRVGDPHDQRLLERPALLLETHVERRCAELTSQKQQLEERCEADGLEVRRIGRLIELNEWVIHAAHDIPTMAGQIEALQRLRVGVSDAELELAQFGKRSAFWDEAERKAAEGVRWRRQLEATDLQFQQLSQSEAMARLAVEAANNDLASAQAVHSETRSVGWLTRAWRGLPPPEQQEEAVKRATTSLQLRDRELASLRLQLTEARGLQARLRQELDAFAREYGGSPSEIVAKVDAYRSQTETLRDQLPRLRNACKEREVELRTLFRSRIAALSEWGLIDQVSDEVEAMVDAIAGAFQRAQEMLHDIDTQKLCADRDTLSQQIRMATEEIDRINNELTRVEESIIANATIVATTLTRAYLRDPIQNRRFDTVLLDEASMAPIPALWLAAGLADANVVLVGDYKQLPPIVVAEDEVARKWLGRDIFDVAGLAGGGEPPPFVVPLRRQYRMHPDISLVANALVYGHLLEDDPCTLHDGGLQQWYREDWGADCPVLLVDTGSLNAWVTSVPRGGSSSRLNFLSAMVCVDLAECMLRSDRDKLGAGAQRRILIVSPYRPHAHLVEHLLRDQQLDDDVLSGTAHTFQGSEADAVILDLVNDEPHWKVGMFNPKRDENTIRLLNVALTRARRRLIVVGDFGYVEKLGKNAFVGRLLIPFLRARYRCVEALQFVPAGLASRTVAAMKPTNVSGDLEPDGARLIVTQSEFYQYLERDLAQARIRIVIYSAFLTDNRLGQLQVHLRAAIERGVRVFIVTKALSERKDNERGAYRHIEQALRSWGVIIIPKRGMHEKLVLIDDAIVWLGSLNPLSFSNTQEIMERRISRTISEDYARLLRLNELLTEFSGDCPMCPYCGSEVIAAEGNVDPYYWRCVNDGCYSRSIGQPRVSDSTTCDKCGGTLEFGEWGGKPAWRCTANRKHRRKLKRAHLRVPGLRALIASEALICLDDKFGITADDKRRSRRSSGGQLGLFDHDYRQALKPEPELTKEVWRMSRREFHQFKEANLPAEEIDRAAINREYRDSLVKALSDGKPVNVEFLREFGLS